MKNINGKLFGVLAIVLLALQIISIPDTSKAKEWAPPNDEELVNNNFIVYFVNAGDLTPDTVPPGEKLGLYQSNTEQVYGEDPVTGKKWGYTTTYKSSIRDTPSTNKFDTVRYYDPSIEDKVPEKGLEYKFELPDGSYEVTLGFKNPWSTRESDILLNGNLVENRYVINEGQEQTTTYDIDVLDGELTIDIVRPTEGGSATSQWADPLVSFIIIKVKVDITKQELQYAIRNAESINRSDYTEVSIDKLDEALIYAYDVLNDEHATGEEMESAFNNLMNAINNLTEPYTSFVPGDVWNDTDGDFIQAHGGGIMKVGDTYYWYGEDKTNGYLPATGVHAYSSKDLYNWKDEGVVMRAVENREDLDNDPYFSELYKNRTSEEKDVIFSDINAERGVLERPKVIYNEKTDKYVLWLHVDGPYEGSDSNYAKAKAGVAISDSPTGPFEYIESNRLNKMPEGYEYRVRNTGMSRDMTLFKDDDGTAYIIYASEENYSLYISKLNEDYTAISGEEYGVDFIRALYDQHREAPAMFKYDGKYYLITSGATGWDPNPARYHVADSVLGEWTDMGNPVQGDGASTTHSSQSTHVIPIDPDNGEFFYMGDRWNRGDLKNSRYIWLPLEFNQDGEMSLKWYDEWQLEDLKHMGKIKVLTEIPGATEMGEIPDLPEELEVISGGDRKLVPVEWDLNQDTFSKPGTVTITGTLISMNDRQVSYDIYVIPNNVKYFINPSEDPLSDYQDMTSYMTDTLINANINDQKYDPENGNTWGYSGGNTLVSNGDDIFSSLRYIVKDSEQKDFTYTFEIANGNYTIYTGFYDPWAMWSDGNRKADIFVNDMLVDFEYTYSDEYDVRAYEDIDVNNGKIELKIQPSESVADKEDSDSQISWIMIVENELDQPKVDTYELKELIKIAQNISNEDRKYTERSFDVLRRAINEAENVLDVIKSEEELEEAMKQLQSAMDGLVKIDEFAVSDMLKILKDFKDDISDESYRLLNTHLISVDHYEKQKDVSKIMKHMESFKLLIDYQIDNKLITKELYDILKADTNSLMSKWQ